MQVKALIFGRDEQLPILDRLLSEDEELTIVGGSSQEAQIVELVSRTGADLLAVFIDGTSAAFRVAEQVYMLKPHCTIVGVCNELDMNEAMEYGMRCGIRRIIPRESSRDEALSELKALVSVERQRAAALSAPVAVSADAQVFTFFSVKGGLGKTTVLTNMAACLAQAGQRVIVLDFDLQFGDIADAMSIDSRVSLSDLLQEQGNPTIDSIRQYIAIHESGVNVLCAPRSPEFAESITGAQVSRIILSLRPHYDYIFIDTSSYLDDVALVCFEQSSRILLVTKPSIPILRGSKKSLLVIEGLGMIEKTSLVVTQVEKDGKIGVADVERVLGVRAWFSVPFDAKAVMSSLNQGVPLIALSAKSPVAKAISAAAKELTAFDVEQEGARQGRRKLMFKK